MDGLGEELLACATLADDQRGLIDLRDAPGLLQALGHGRTVPLDIREGVAGHMPPLCNLMPEGSLQIGQLRNVLEQQDVEVPLPVPFVDLFFGDSKAFSSAMECAQSVAEFAVGKDEVLQLGFPGEIPEDPSIKIGA